MLELLFDGPPSELYAVHREYAAAASPARTPNSNFLRGVKWSPDGACLMTASDDNCLRIFDTPLEAFQLANPEAAAGAAGEPEAAGQRVPAQPPAAASTQQAGSGEDSLAPALRIQEGELIYDWCWYSRMSAAEPASCCLATTGRAQPVHLWDALTGQLRCSYRAYNDMDEVEPAHSLAFDSEGSTLFCGFSRGLLRSFRLERPGRDCATILAHKKGGEGLPGIISCLAPNPDRSGMLAAGSYSGAAALVDPRTRELLCLLEGGHTGGITHLCFSADGNFLYTGARKDGAVRCWDVRYGSGVVYAMQRPSRGTNQRMFFDVEPCGRHLATGGEDGVVRLFDLRDGSEAGQFPAAQDTVNGVAFHPFLPLLATASGQRRYFLAPCDDSSSLDSESDSEDSSMAAADGSGSESGCKGQGPGGQPAAAAAAAAGLRLSARENVLQVWQCVARTLQVPEEMAATEEATEEGGDDAEMEAAAEMVLVECHTIEDVEQAGANEDKIIARLKLHRFTDDSNKRRGHGRWCFVGGMLQVVDAQGVVPQGARRLFLSASGQPGDPKVELLRTLLRRARDEKRHIMLHGGAVHDTPALQTTQGGFFNAGVRDFDVQFDPDTQAWLLGDPVPAGIGAQPPAAAGAAGGQAGGQPVAPAAPAIGAAAAQLPAAAAAADGEGAGEAGGPAAAALAAAAQPAAAHLPAAAAAAGGEGAGEAGGPAAAALAAAAQPAAAHLPAAAAAAGGGGAGVHHAGGGHWAQDCSAFALLERHRRNGQVVFPLLRTLIVSAPAPAADVAGLIGADNKLPREDVVLRLRDDDLDFNWNELRRIRQVLYDEEKDVEIEVGPVRLLKLHPPTFGGEPSDKDEDRTVLRGVGGQEREE
ncbi:telomerase Cajal body 1 [Chlorella sorokiniana]|uniref:Telomerase Cajal body 1 n=1 Tax=Chlorella sorokiniana TaxID=3076 RepID=A0A2P6U2Y8_CHLSO|nr:telomerase Cajal body 1 [Chlorella sorokiniana]|eukprot:PRW60676.1 telomerase Cajal body 1 [Chlorella sorokiniana]